MLDNRQKDSKLALGYRCTKSGLAPPDVSCGELLIDTIRWNILIHSEKIRRVVFFLQAQ